MRSKTALQVAPHPAEDHSAQNGMEGTDFPFNQSNGATMPARCADHPTHRELSRNGNGFRKSALSDPSEMSLREALTKMIRRMTPNSALREDLLQEATVHLWLTETRRPGQTRSWYLQSCKFHLQHYLNVGRSIDSAKRWRGQLPSTDYDYAENADSSNEQSDSGNSVFTCVSAREIMSLLQPYLTAQEQEVLICLAEGLGAREIGRKLNLSHTMAIRHRRKIAALFKRLELPPAEDSEIPKMNGANHRNGPAKALRRDSNGARHE